MMRILLTGASGFLGTAIYKGISNARIYTLGRSRGLDYECNLSEGVTFLQDFELVIHSAGRAHMIPKTLEERQAFFDVNVKGTENLLKGIEGTLSLPKFFVFISTVAVYGRDEGYMINEQSPLLAKDPYGLSKIQAEKLVQEWCTKHNVICSILRLPLLAGPNPPGNLKTMINGIQKGYYFNVGGGGAKKSIVLVNDVAKVIPIVAKIGGVYNLTDGYNPSFFELSELIAKQLNKSNPLNIPKWTAKLIAKIGDLFGKHAPINSNKLIKITNDLTFDDTKAVKSFQWNPTPVLNGFKIK